MVDNPAATGTTDFLMPIRQALAPVAEAADSGLTSAIDIITFHAALIEIVEVD